MELSESVIEIICKNLKLSYEEIMEMDDEELIKHVEKITGKKVVVKTKSMQYPKEEASENMEVEYENQ